MSSVSRVVYPPFPGNKTDSEECRLKVETLSSWEKPFVLGRVNGQYKVGKLHPISGLFVLAVPLDLYFFRFKTAFYDPCKPKGK